MEKLKIKKKKTIWSDLRRIFYTVYWLEKARTAIVWQCYADLSHNNFRNWKTGGRIILPIAALSRTLFVILQACFHRLQRTIYFGWFKYGRNLNGEQAHRVKRGENALRNKFKKIFSNSEAYRRLTGSLNRKREAVDTVQTTVPDYDISAKCAPER